MPNDPNFFGAFAIPSIGDVGSWGKFDTTPAITDSTHESTTSPPGRQRTPTRRRDGPKNGLRTSKSRRGRDLPAGELRTLLYAMAEYASRFGAMIVLWDDTKGRPVYRANKTKSGAKGRPFEKRLEAGELEIVGVYEVTNTLDDVVDMLHEDLEPYGLWAE